MGWLELIEMPSDGILYRSDCNWLCCLLCQLLLNKYFYEMNGLIPPILWMCQREISLLKACLFTATGVVWINFIEFCFESLAMPPRNSTKVTPKRELRSHSVSTWTRRGR